MLAAVLLAGLAAHGPAAGGDPPSPARVASAFARMSEPRRHELVEWYRYELLQRASLQTRFVRHVLDERTRPRDPGTWPGAEPPVAYDPAVHTPGQSARRRTLAVSDRRVRAARERFRLEPAPGAPARGWMYDWASGQPRRLADGRDVQRAFENAVAGLPPEVDLAEALLLQWLDDGEDRAAHAAFAHAYVDRQGNVHPGITLWDAWASGEEFEVPDVDALGLVHDLVGDWSRWTAPVAERERGALYGAIAQDLFAPVRARRALREALALTYMVASPPLPRGYEEHADRLHALWELHGASPDRLARALDAAQDAGAFFGEWVDRTSRDGRLLEAGRARRWALAQDEDNARDTLVRLLREMDAL